MGHDALPPEPDAGEEAPRPREPLAAGLEQILDVEPEERALRRLVGAVAEAIPPADSAALLVRGEGGRLEVVAGVGLSEAAPEWVDGGLAGEALATGSVRLGDGSGHPFPEGTRASAAAPLRAGLVTGALVVGSRTAPGFDADALALVRAAADRAALVLDRARLTRERDAALESAHRAEAEVESRRKAVDYILGIVGHDLRNPLGAVHMSAALLQKKGGLQGWQGRTVERMRSSAGRMGRIIADLLSYTRTRLGKGIPIERREANLEAIVRKVVDELRAVNTDREILVEAEEDVTGVWDADRLEQVASNLVSNAIDHGDPAAPVRVRVDCDADVARLVVRNEGPSMPPEVLAHLFEPFSRAPDEKSRKASGLGLGLYISREIVVRGHGGDIDAVSNGETVVTVRLPRFPDPAPPA